MARAIMLVILAMVVVAMGAVDLVQAQCGHYSSGQLGCYTCCLRHGMYGDLFGSSNECVCI